MLIIIGSLLGFLSVVFGTYASHGLRKKLDSADFENAMTGVRYNQIHAVMISAIGLAAVNLNDNTALVVSGYMMALGTFIFSFSIYFSFLLKNKSLRVVTPFGGTLIMISWLALAWSGYTLLSQPSFY